MIYEHSIGRLGSRFFLDFIPFQKKLRTSAVGRFFDNKEELVIASENNGKIVCLPFSDFSRVFEEMDEHVFPTSVVYTGYDRYSGIEIDMKVSSPHVPGDIAASSYPFMYLDVTVFYKGITKITGDAIEKGCGPEEFTGKFYIGFKKAFSERISAHESSVMHRFWSVDSTVAKRKWLDSTTHPEYSRKSIEGKIALTSLSSPLCNKDGIMEFSLDGIKKGKRLTFQFVFSAYVSDRILLIDGKEYPFLYNKNLSSIDDVFKYAVTERSRLEKLDGLFVDSLNTSLFGSGYRYLVSVSLQSYLLNTWLIDNQSSDGWFSVTEGNCSYHNTVDVEYNSGPWYLLYWPELMLKVLESWNTRLKAGGYMPHDIGKFLVISKMEYSHDMEVEESCNFILLLYALWKWHGLLNIKEFSSSLSACLEYVISSDTTGNGFPDHGTANTFDDAEGAVQFSKEQTYLAIKAYSALIAGGKLLRQIGSSSIADKAIYKSKIIAKNLEPYAFLGDHYAVSIQRNADGVVNVWTGEKLLGELNGWDAASPYSANGLYYLLLTDTPIDFCLESIKKDLEYVIQRRGYYANCHSTANPDGNFWISQNIWRDEIALYFGINTVAFSDDYSDFEKKMLSFDNGGGFIDSETAGGLFSYPRGICSIFLPYAAAGMRYDSKDRKLSFSPVVLPLRLSLSQFANFKDGIIPYIDFSIENGEVKTKVINEEALDGVSVYVYGKKEN